MEQKKRRGGARPNSGRPPKDPNWADNWGQITCVLRKDTIEKLRQGAGGKNDGKRFYGKFLQHHLDKFPLPTRQAYMEEMYLTAWRDNRESLTPEQVQIVKSIKARRAHLRKIDRVETAQKRVERANAKLTPAERKATDKSLREWAKKDKAVAA
jgi:hypothetical protein